jgi:catalase
MMPQYGLESHHHLLRDPRKFPNLYHAVKRDPRTKSAQRTQQLGFLDFSARSSAPDYD